MTDAELKDFHMAEEEKRRALARAIETRLLTKEELLEAMRQRSYLFVEEFVPYMPATVERRFSDALQFQLILRSMETK